MKELLKVSGFILAVSFSAWGVFGSGYSTDSVSKVEVIPYPVETIYDDTVREGVETIRQVGKDGEKEVIYEALAECRADSSKFNCWYDAYPGTILHWSYYTYSSVPGNSSVRYGAICRDGTRSNATGRGGVC